MTWALFLHLMMLGSAISFRAVDEKLAIDDTAIVTQQRLQLQVNSELLTQFRLSPPNTGVIQQLVSEQLANESAVRRVESTADKELFVTGSALDQHRSFTAGNGQSIELGISHRPNVVELETTFKLLKVSTTDAKRLITAGFGPFIKCNPFLLCNANSPYRTADGRCNNLQNPTWGKASIPMRRWLQPDYADGISQPRGVNLPSARLVSREIHTDSGPSDQHRRYTHMLMQWGQFLDHDITKTPSQQRQSGYGSGVSCCGRSHFFRPECFPINIPAGDPHFTQHCMDFVRSVQVANAKCKPAPVEQLNEITAYIDASQVYGSSQSEQNTLRTFTDGKLKQKGDFLPKDSQNSCNTPGPLPNYCFKAGDGRVNENPTLQSMHTIFVREHNRVASKLKELVGNTWNDEKLFQESRKIVGAIMQKITYGEYLPIVLGNTEMNKYGLKVGTGSAYTNQYRTYQDASIRNAFAAAAFRMGHSMIQDMLSSINQLYDSVASDNLSDVFGDTNFILSDPVRRLGHYTRGLVHDCVQKVDKKMSSEVTNNLFKDSFGRSLDLAALNIQRGRDHGVPGYIHWRRYCRGGSLPTSFSQLSTTHAPAAITKLQHVYSNVGDIDLFTGGLTETPAPGSMLGPTFSCLLGKQFQALRRGDRLWFEEGNAKVLFNPGQLKELRKATLSRVICDNTNTFEIQENAFVKDNNKKDCCSLPSIDLTKWIPPTWGGWGPWGPCKDGLQVRSRSCVMGDCKGPNTEARHCQSCSWSSWTTCSLWSRSRSRSLRCTEGCYTDISTFWTHYHSTNLLVSLT